jgi:hypothetical protein
MTSSASPGDVSAWEVVADRLERLAAAPTAEQVRIAKATGIELPMHVPASVAAVILRAGLAEALFQSIGRAVEIPDALSEIEVELGLDATTWLITGSREEVSAWFGARYMLKTAVGLRELRPEVGDVVSGVGLNVQRRVISSIGRNGRIYLKGVPTRSAWPKHLRIVSRKGHEGYDAVVQEVDAVLRNGRSNYSSNFARFTELEEFCLPSSGLAPEAVRELEELLESGEPGEAAFQRLIERHPALLALTVSGGWSTYVIPQARLGAEHVTDFLVLGINSVGPQWLTIEIEAPRHKLLNKDGTLTKEVRHAIKQIEDWREWLTLQVAYAQGGSRAARTGLALYGITNRAPGLVIIGRDDPSSERQSARSQSSEGARIDIHSWDWLLRQAMMGVAAAGRHVSEFALENARNLSGVAWRNSSLISGTSARELPDGGAYDAIDTPF